MQFHAARQVYGSLLAAGIEIYEYQAGFLHAKVAVVDQRWATVGSSNLDPLSLQLAREANVVVGDRAFAQALQLRLERIMAHSAERVQATDYAQRPWRQRVLDGLAFGAMWLMLVLTGRRY
jgi:cardiolipin synthase